MSGALGAMALACSALRDQSKDSATVQQRVATSASRGDGEVDSGFAYPTKLSCSVTINAIPNGCSVAFFGLAEWAETPAEQVASDSSTHTALGCGQAVSTCAGTFTCDCVAYRR